ncbi:hypothetical protein ACJRO7_020303 [Eucalyptus globulus]|uniref:Uncharacterized protein n=1 Tax=Eucalyptus globulus TaxID=34317 RepID=A0ABD3KGC3_EUCGL
MNLYFVFQGIVFSSMLTSSETIRCKLKWTFYALSLLASIYNSLAVLVNIRRSLKYYENMALNWDLHDKLRVHLANLRVQERNNANAQAAVEQQKNANAEAVPQQQNNANAQATGQQQNTLCYLTVLLLLIFSAAMLYGFSQIHYCHRCSFG